MSDFIAGHYTATLATRALGKTEEGFRISHIDYIDPVRVDEHGDAQVDGVYRGFNARISVTLCEWTAAAVNDVMHWFDDAATIGKYSENIGKLVVQDSIAKAMVLTPVLSATGKYTYTFANCIPEGDRPFNLNNRLQKYTLNLLALMDPDTSIVMARSGGA